MFCLGQEGVGAGGDDIAEGVGEEVVEFFEEGFACLGESGEPGSGHADSLDALAREEEGGLGAG